MGGRHDRPKVVCAPDRDLARLRGTVRRPPSAVSSFGGFRTPAAEYAAPSLKRPASETLHNIGSGQSHSSAVSARAISALQGVPRRCFVGSDWQACLEEASLVALAI